MKTAGVLCLALLCGLAAANTLNRKASNKVSFDFHGLMAPVFTPFNDDEERSLNTKVILDYAQYLLDKNITGVLVGGTNGEGTALSLDEKKELAKAWAEAVKVTKQHLMIHVGGAALHDVKAFAAYADELNVDSLLTLPELYFKPSSTNDLIEYLREIGESAPNTPLIYYQSSKAPISVKSSDLLKSVGDRVPTFVGVKLDSSDISDGLSALAVGKGAVIYGAKMTQLAGCVIGVDTFMSATMNFHPEPSFKVLDFCAGNGDLATARQNQDFINKMEKAVTSGGSKIEAMKTATSIITKIPMGPPRAPLKALTRKGYETMVAALTKLGFKIGSNVPYRML